uniref:hypothetical protein n=1 Tax=Nocardioides alcanivorans TaxID=2897352 RepID=UPI001F350B07
SRIIRTGLAAVATTALALTLTAAPAQAAKAVKSQVTIGGYQVSGGTKITIDGKVKAKKAFCKKGRKVVLKQITDNQKAGTAKTNKKGVWKVKFNGNKISPGEFKATVKKKVVKKNGKKFTCKAAKVKKVIGES